MTTLALIAAAGCGVGNNASAPVRRTYTADNPPPFVHGPEVRGLNPLTEPGWYQVAGGQVLNGQEATIAGGHYELQFYPGSLTVGQLDVTIHEFNPQILAFELGPHGSQFNVPVRLEISYAGTNADPSSPNYEPGALESYWMNPATSVWEQVPGTNDLVQKTYTVFLPHFSLYGLAIIDGTADW
jgi:hypothetical protein